MVGASGDNAPGWGLRPLSNVSGQQGAWDGAQTNNGTIRNYRIDPGFYVDLILWRQLVGTVTDALIFRPGVQYNFTDGLGVRGDLVYSRAWFAESTPSASFQTAALEGSPSKNLGVELDAKLFYGTDDGFHAWFEYGMFVPMGGLDREVRSESTDSQAANAAGQPVRRLNASIAHTFQLMLGVAF